MAERPAPVRGRPLRALAAILTGWVAIRVAWLWPDAALPPVARPIARATPGIAAPRPVAMLPVVAPARRRQAAASAPPPSVPHRAAPENMVAPAPAPAPATAAPRADVQHVLALLGLVRFGTPAPEPRGPSRWSGSAWAIVRGQGRAGGVATPQLGGSQAGMRLAYALDDHVAVAIRAASALAVRQQEAAIGLEWRPGTLPLRVVAEQRIGIARARGGPALGLVGGVDDRPLPLGLTLDGYAQAGVIARDGGEGYADGAVRVGRAVGTLDLSLGAWGAAQRGAARLDVGPSIALAVPVAQRRVRLSLDWRARVAGNARPASGPALSIGTDF